MRIGILQTGHAPETLIEKHGDYDAMFRSLLKGEGFEFATYAVVDGIFPEGPADADGWLITGSRYGVYEDHSWIPPLEALIRAIVERRRPLVGICFGHQIIAQALGGRVQKYGEGWTIGLQRYDRADGGTPQAILAWHQDQVVEKPLRAEVLGSSPNCRFAILTYGESVLSYQAHPEFGAAFLTDLFDARGGELPSSVREGMISGESLRGTLSTMAVAGEIVSLLRGKAPRAGC